MVRNAAFWDKHRVTAVSRSFRLAAPIIRAGNRLYRWRRKQKRLRNGILGGLQPVGYEPYSESRLRDLIRCELMILAILEGKRKKLNQRADYCEGMAKQCRERTIWDRVRARSELPEDRKPQQG